MNSNINFFGQQERRCRREKEIQKKTIVNCIDKQRAESQTLRFTRMHWLFIYMHICGWVWVRTRELYTHAHRVPRARSLTTTRIRQLTMCVAVHIYYTSAAAKTSGSLIYTSSQLETSSVLFSLSGMRVFMADFLYTVATTVCVCGCVFRILSAIRTQNTDIWPYVHCCCPADINVYVWTSKNITAFVHWLEQQ